MNHINKVYIVAVAMKGIWFTSVSNIVGRGDIFRASKTVRYVDWEDDIFCNLYIYIYLFI